MTIITEKSNQSSADVDMRTAADLLAAYQKNPNMLVSLLYAHYLVNTKLDLKTDPDPTVRQFPDHVYGDWFYQYLEEVKQGLREGTDGGGGAVDARLTGMITHAALIPRDEIGDRPWINRVLRFPEHDLQNLGEEGIPVYVPDIMTMTILFEGKHYITREMPLDLTFDQLGYLQIL